VRNLAVEYVSVERVVQAPGHAGEAPRAGLRTKRVEPVQPASPRTRASRRHLARRMTARLPLLGMMAPE
jgi:hypothetical protein